MTLDHIAKAFIAISSASFFMAISITLFMNIFNNIMGMVRNFKQSYFK